MSDKKKDLSELNDYDEELDLENSEEEYEEEVESEEETESEEEYEEEAESEEETESEEEYEEEVESEEETESEEEYEEEAESEEETESEEEYEEEVESKEETESEEEYEKEAESEEEYEEDLEEDEEVETKSSRKLIYGLGAITILAGGYFGYQQISTPSYNNVQPAQPTTTQSSNTGVAVVEENDNVAVDSGEASIEGNDSDITPDDSINQEPIVEDSVAQEPMPVIEEADTVTVTISEDEYNDLIERIENLEELVSEREEVIVDFEDRFSVLDDLIQTVESTNQRIDQIEQDIVSMQESFAIIDEMKKEQEKLSNKIEVQQTEEVEEKSDTSSEKKGEINVTSKKDVTKKESEEKADKKKEESVKTTNTSNKPKFIPESERQVIPGWKGVATMNNGNKVAIDLGDGRFITLVENEPVKVYGRVQRIANDGTVYFRTHKINFMN